MVRILIVFIFSFHIALAQNLVPDPGFENINVMTCDLIGSHTEYDSRMIDWSVPNESTPDIFTNLNQPSCYSNCFSTHQYSIGQQQTHGGNYMSCISTFGFGCSGIVGYPHYREYVQTQLTSPLVVGETYYAEMYVSLSEDNNYASNNIGMHFSTDEIYFETCFNLNYEPQIIDTTIITDSLGWVKISGTFVATEPYEYLIIGNMSDDDNTDSITIKNLPYYHKNLAYYFLDDVLVEQVTCANSETNLRYCAPDSITLTNNTTSFIMGWANADTPGNIFSTSNSITVSPTQDESYFCYTGCDTAKFNLFYAETPTLDLGPDTMFFCEYQDVVLDAYYSPNTRYNWSQWNTDSVLIVDSEGYYSVEISDMGCEASDAVQIYFDPLADIDLDYENYKCYGDTVEIFLEMPPGATFVWNDGDSTSFPKKVTESGKYTVEVSIHGCTESDFANILFYETPVVDLGPDTSFCNDEFVLDLSIPPTEDTVRWYSGSDKFKKSVNQPGIYWVEVIHEDGCKTRDSIIVSVDGNCTPVIECPNIFTPNGDGVNDYFIPLEHLNIFEPILFIHNRWGTEVYQTEDLQSGWDGSIHDQDDLCPEGTYFWTIQYEDAFGKQDSKSGSLYLSR